MSLSLFLQQCPVCLVHQIWMVFEMGGRTVVVLWDVASMIYSIWLIVLYVVLPYSSIDTTAAWKKLRFISSDRSDFHMTENLSIATHAFASRILMSFSVDETLLPR